MADADPHAPEVRADRRLDRAQAIVAGSAAAPLHPELARSEVDLVINDGDLVRRDLVEARTGTDRIARTVHEGLRLQQKHPHVADRAFGQGALELGTEGRHPVAEGDRVRRQEADIVPRLRVAAARIAEPDQETHVERRRSPAVSPAWAAPRRRGPGPPEPRLARHPAPPRALHPVRRPAPRAPLRALLRA